MSRTAVMIGHALGSLVAVVLYVLFVLPRWWELTGSVSHSLGTGLRIVTGLVIAAAAVPVLVNLLHSRKPEFGTPLLALQLKLGSMVAQVLAGVLIIGTAISEIWLSLDVAGQWLFAVYGAAAAIAVLGIAAFYLSFVAELPPPAPKPLKPAEPKSARLRFRRRKPAESADEAETEATELIETGTETGEAEAEGTAEAEETVEAETVEAETETVATADSAAEPADATEPAPATGLRNRRPSGKSSRKRRGRGGAD